MTPDLPRQSCFDPHIRRVTHSVMMHAMARNLSHAAARGRDGARGKPKIARQRTRVSPTSGENHDAEALAARPEAAQPSVPSPPSGPLYM